MKKKFIKTIFNQYLLSFLIPAIVVLFYYIFRHFYPFGNSSILTVDLGQQYIDMFAGFRNTILHHPEQIFYSFSKNFGGEMFSEWFYYISSPLNFIFLFFKQKYLTVGILFLTVLRFGLAGLSMQFFLIKKFLLKKNFALIFSISYAISGWMVGNQVNLLWQDQIILLPLLALVSINAVKQNRFLPLILLFAFSIIDNFYIAYMIGLFLPFFCLWEISRLNENKKIKITKFTKFIGSMFVSVFLSSIILIPIIFQLAQGKGQDILSQINWGFAKKSYLTILKLLPGSFDFDQMKNGQANIFVPFINILGTIIYFFNKKEKILTKTIALFLIIFYLLSFVWQPLNIFLHMMQYPAWYPYRYSFIFCFIIIYLAALGIRDEKIINWKSVIISFLIVILISSFSFTIYKSAKSNNISPSQIILFFIISSLTIIIYLYQKKISPNKWLITLILITLISSASNLYISTNNFSYLTQGEYQRTINALQKATNFLPKKGFYRVGQTFSRTRGDPYSIGYNGGMHFSSTVDKLTPELFGAFGQTASDYYTSYSHGTILSDALFSMKYFIAPNPKSSRYLSGSPKKMGSAYRPDLSNYQLKNKNRSTYTYENKNVLPIAFLANKNVSTNKILLGNPLLTTNNLWHGINGHNTLLKTGQTLFFRTKNLKKMNKLYGYAQKINKQEDGIISMNIRPKNNDSYYITIPNTFNINNIWISINGKEIPQSAEQRDVVPLNVANNDKNKNINVSFHIKKNNIFLNNFQLYSMNYKKLKKEVSKIKQKSLKHISFSQTKITGIINNTNKNNVLMTTIPKAKGWHAYINGKERNPITIDKYFLGFKLKKGKQKVTISYREPYFRLSLIISLSTLIIVLLVNSYNHKTIKKA